jgi:hypothetical protein
MPLILGANSLAGGGYEVDNSLRFDGTAYAQRSISISGSGTTSTFSAWVKPSALPDKVLFTSYIDANNYVEIYFNSGKFRVFHYDSGATSNDIMTNALYRDQSAWYHFHVIFDTTNGTEADRIKIYVNGNQVTSFQTANYPTASQDMELNSSSATFNLGARNADEQWKGYMSEVNWIDGQALDPDNFGEFDSDSGIWKPIAYTGSYGTNGFLLEFKDSSALGDDTSGNGNDFTVNNLTSIDQTTDTPTNNFATANPLHFNATIPSAGTLSDGNLTFTSSQGASAYPAFYSTIGASQGKWYAEFKVTTANSAIIGIGSGIATGGFLGGGLYDYAYYYDGTFYNNGSNQGTQSSYTDGDIISVAMDLDNNKIYVAKDNVWQHSGDPSAGTGGFVITAPASNNTGTYLIAYGDAGGGTPAIQGNFGNPPFAITTGNADADGFGNFEYAVPLGYYALNTKNLAEYG